MCVTTQCDFWSMPARFVHLNVIEGADRVAAFLAGVVRKGWTDDLSARLDILNGLPGVIKAIYVVRNPDKLRHLA